MPKNRRSRLAKALAQTTDLTYQQALVRLDAHVAAGHPLPRTDDDLHALTGELPPAPPPAAELRRIADLPAGDAIKVIRFSDIGRCPTGVISPDHYLPDGTCAHAAPVCPTCRGTGRLLDPEGTEQPCAASSAGLPFYTPVCDETGTWAGARAGRPTSGALEAPDTKTS